MPLITPFPDATRAYMRVEVNWADTPAVRYARVLRVNPATGECVPLRPYVCFDGDYLLLSCGHGIFWDTELPLDTEIYYLTEGIDSPCVPTSPFLLDTFNRDLTDSWGSTDTGQPYTLSGGTNPGNYDVSVALGGTHTLDTVNTRRHSWADSGQSDQNIYADATLPVASATGAGITQWLLGRLSDVNNWYAARIELSTTGTVTLTLAERVAGVVTDLTAATTVGTGHAANDLWTIRLSVDGSSLRAKAWLASTAEPTSWQLTATDTSLAAGTNVGVADRLETGSGNSPLISSWRRLLVGDPCAPCTPVTAQTPTVTMASGGAFAFGDPVRPCNDFRVPLCFTQPTGDPACVPGNGVFFASMDVEDRESNDLVINPTNASLPLAMTRDMRGISSVFTLVTRTFADRDALIELVKPGGPVMLRGPVTYGVIDQYMVGRLSTQRGLSDHKYPVRVNDYSYVQVRRPAGPSLGVCGSQVQDMCDIYDTWQAIDDAGLNWDDLIRGRASHDGGDPIADYRTWTVGPNTVLADFADWNAVNSGTRDWIELEEGL